MKRIFVAMAVAVTLAATAFAADPPKSNPVVFPPTSIGTFFYVEPSGFGFRDVGQAAGTYRTDPAFIGYLKPSHQLAYKPGYWQQVPRNLEGLDLSGLEMDNGTVSGIVNKLPNLRYLNIGDTEVDDGVFELLPKMPRLQILFAAQLALTGSGLKYLSKFPNLQTIDLHKTTVKAENFKHLLACPNLQGLSLHESAADDRACAELSKLAKLRSVSLSRTAVTTKVGQALYPARNTLVHLDLYLCDVGDDGLLTIGKFNALQSLTLGRFQMPELTAHSIECLRGAKNLQLLNLCNTRIRDDVVQAIPKYLPQLTNLSMNDCKNVTDKGLGSLGGASRLQTLNALNSGAGDNLMRGAVKLRKLDRLLVGGGSISDAGAKAFFDSASPVSTLSIDNCKITDKGLASISKLPNLHTLSLNGDNVSDAAVPALVKCKKLMRLGLRGTKVTADGVSRLRQALPHCYIFI